MKDYLGLYEYLAYKVTFFYQTSQWKSMVEQNGQLQKLYYLPKIYIIIVNIKKNNVRSLEIKSKNCKISIFVGRQTDSHPHLQF